MSTRIGHDQETHKTHIDFCFASNVVAYSNKHIPWLIP